MLQIYFCLALSLAILKSKGYFINFCIDKNELDSLYPSRICSAMKNTSDFKNTKQIGRHEFTDKTAGYFHFRIHIAGFFAECFELNKMLR